jgi:hypothetical protein
VLLRLQWVAHLEFSHNKEVCDLTWDKVEVQLPRTEKLRSMVRSGIPHSLRPQMWMRLSGEIQTLKLLLLLNAVKSCWLINGISETASTSIIMVT